ncbi:hypothetical protein ABIF65_007423 [Bradyrhizobium japonicum]
MPGLGTIQNFPDLGIEITQAIGLEVVSQDRKREMPWQVTGRFLAKDAPPSRPESPEVEIAQMRDLLRNGNHSRAAAGAPAAHLHHAAPLTFLLTGAATALPSVRCQSAFDWDPLSASKRDPFDRRALLVALGSSELVGVAETARARVV